MKKHKWKDISYRSPFHFRTSLKGDKKEVCIKCGVYRDWQYGDMQCWQYWHPRKSEFEEVKTTFKRPDCINNPKHLNHENS